MNPCISIYPCMSHIFECSVFLRASRFMAWIRLGIASCVFFVTTKVTKFVLNDPILPAFHLMRNCLLQSFGCLNTQASQDIWSTRECSYSFSFSILLMVQKSGKLTSWDGHYPIIYRVSYMSGGWPRDFWTINSRTCWLAASGKMGNILQYWSSLPVQTYLPHRSAATHLGWSSTP